MKKTNQNPLKSTQSESNQLKLSIEVKDDTKNGLLIWQNPKNKIIAAKSTLLNQIYHVNQVKNEFELIIENELTAELKFINAFKNISLAKLAAQKYHLKALNKNNITNDSKILVLEALSNIVDIDFLYLYITSSIIIYNYQNFIISEGTELNDFIAPENPTEFNKRILTNPITGMVVGKLITFTNNIL